jgi:thymidylate synthase ThyX
MIKAKIIADSINTYGNRITSFLLTYPRFIHSELMTHRMFSRNAASSRAIPVEKIIKSISEEPAMPCVWGKNQRGMQAEEALSGVELEKAMKIWHLSKRRQIKYAQMLLQLGLHKQVANRILEPFMHMTTLVTATEYANFFNLRAHKDAQPEFQELAFLMLEEYISSEPKVLQIGSWHLPFADKYLDENLSEAQLLKIVTARAARLSYMTFEGDIDHNKDYDLHDKLIESGHWSPAEHPARALGKPERSGNFVGWLQYRKLFTNENRIELNPENLFQQRRLINGEQNSMGKMERPIRTKR